MTNVTTKLKRLLNKFLSFFPSPVPTGMTEFNTWVDSIIDTWTLPSNSRDDIKFALAAMIMHQGPTAAYKPKFYFVLCLKAGAAKQIAGATFREIKEKQAAKQNAEATALLSVANGPQKPGV